MQLHIEKLKQNLLDSWLFETYRISNLLRNDERPRAHDYISDEAAVYVKEAILQTYKIMQCLKILETSSEFRDFVTSMETRTLKLTETAARHSLFHPAKKNIVQDEAPKPQLPAIFLQAMVLEDDLHPYNLHTKGLLDCDRYDEKDYWYTKGANLS